MKGIIYYTDNRLRGPIYELAQKFILASGLEITSCSLNKPIAFGKNVVVEGQRSYPTMVKQIATALENAKEKYVFFCEHDVFYSKCHFDFTPAEDDVFYYNDNVYRWWYTGRTAITWDRMLSLSCMCCNREFALEHYRMRLKKIDEWGLDHFRSREPRKARIWGYEPGTKPMRRGGFSDDRYGVWHSEFPNVDVRHHKTFSSPKITLDSFKHQPTGWQEISVYDLPGWEKGIFDLCN